MITKEVFEQWKELEATKQVMEVLMDQRKRMMETWAEGLYTTDKSNLSAIAMCQANFDLVNLDHDTIREFYGVTE